MDWYSRFVLEWCISISLEATFCVEALQSALVKNRCNIFNTDQGSQFTSKAWIDTLKAHHISISMDGRGRYLDNIFIERLWRSVKQECIYLSEFASVTELKMALTNYFEYYNYQRPIKRLIIIPQPIIILAAFKHQSKGHYQQTQGI